MACDSAGCTCGRRKEKYRAVILTDRMQLVLHLGQKLLLLLTVAGRLMMASACISAA
jgi:hypothetical protein